MATSLVILLNMSIGKLPPLAKFFDPFQGFWQNAEAKPISIASRLSLPALQDSVEVYFDEHLIPHIQAQNDQDLYFAQGYVTALHRLWQMEFQTHAAAGRIAEIVGPASINFDKLQRRKGLLYAAKNALSTVEKDARVNNMVQAYTAGINAYINALSYKDLPVEYKLLAYQPEPWTPLKVNLLYISMADQLCGSDKSFEHTQAFHCLGAEKFHFLYPDYHGQASIIPKKTPWNFDSMPIKTTPFTIPAKIDKVNLAPTHPANGSNNWAVAGKKTGHGFPYLANDPHLTLTLPAIWYAIHLQSPTMNVAGVSMPGAPGVLIGFNESIAWGMTNAAWTVRDWYEIAFKDASKAEYYYDSLLLKSQFVVEEIKIKNSQSVYDTVIYTHLGPIVYDHTFTDQQKPINMAMKWVGHQPGNELLSAYLLNRAKNLKEFEAALQYYHIPAQNFAFASTQNDIALEIAGQFPARWKNQGRFIMPGNKTAYEWQGFIPKKHHPKIVNPVYGYVSSANERATDQGYPYYYLQFYEEYYRNRRINQVLSQLKKIDEKAMMQLQNDNFNLAAQENLGLLLRYIDVKQLNTSEQKAYQALVDWNLQNEAEQVGPAIFKAWQKQLNAMLWGALHEQALATSHPNFYYTMHILKNHAQSPYLHLGTYDSLQALVIHAFQEGVKELEMWQEKNQQPYKWGNYRNTKIQHLARIAPFGIQELSVNGGEEIVNANNGSHGVSMRLIVSLETLPQGWLIYPGGQPGNPGNPYYTNFVEAWRKGKYVPLSLAKQKETQQKGFSLTLLP